ncbi:MAG TPA: CpsD/CapB family tyrosine-protein kinase [Nevskiaceae bacterium]|nr:CpsD/CapB family tyrosine-protein kinase [Nevskiaceae bacterium]
MSTPGTGMAITQSGLIPGRSAGSLDAGSRLMQALAQRARLSEADLRAIQSLQQQQELRFEEAALRLGLITSADLLAARNEAAAAVVATATVVRELQIAHDPYDRHAERLRALRTELLLRRPAEANTVVLASPGRQEGRSRLAAELAIAFAQLGEPTLLVDADFRHPRQHQLFGVDNEDGLAQVLSRGNARVHAVHGLPQLNVLVTGLRPPQPLELLSGGMFGEALRSWQRRYSHIVIDTPSAEVSDALAVIQQAQRVLICTRVHRTSLTATRELLKRLAAARAEVLGSVMLRF